MSSLTGRPLRDNERETPVATADPKTLAGNKPPSGQEPVAQYLSKVKADLAAEGLPTSAPHAVIALLAEQNGKGGLRSHGQEIARAIAEPIGLAQGAQNPLSAWPARAHTGRRARRLPG
jgi:hypothetical protein